MAVKKERKCPCGSGLKFSECCKTVLDGNTPNDVKRIVESCVIDTFDAVGETRGETCLYVSHLVKDLLDCYGIKSYVVAGAASWSEYPHHYQWKPQHPTRPEFHAWVVTQYGEIVDLACDAFHTRSDAYRSIGPMSGVPSPKRCWNKEPNDREYIPNDIGAKSLHFDGKGYTTLEKIALDKFVLLRNVDLFHLVSLRANPAGVKSSQISAL